MTQEKLLPVRELCLQSENLASEILFYRAPCSARRVGMRGGLTM